MFRERQREALNKQNTTVMKLAETALLAALCYVSFTFLQIKIPVPGEMPLPFILEIPFVYLEPCFWEAGTADLPVLLA